MKKYFVLLCLFLLTFHIIAQESQTPYYQYYKLVNNAELYIINEDYSSSVNEYLQAFQIKGIDPFAKDYYNASLCAIQENKMNLAFDWCKKLVDNGLDKKIIENNPSFLPLVGSKKWKNLISTEPSSFRKSLIDTLNNLYIRDQYYRIKPGSYKIYADSIKMVDKQNDRILRDIIGRYGYPSEKLLGFSNGVGFDQKFEMVIWHQTNLNKISDYTDILRDASKSGLVPPQRAGALIENHTGLSLYNMEPYYKLSCSMCSDSIQSDISKKLFYWEIPKEKLARFDSLRSEIGLESLQDFKMKTLYALEHDSPYLFYGKGAISTFIFRSDEEVVDYQKEKKYIIP